METQEMVVTSDGAKLVILANGHVDTVSLESRPCWLIGRKTSVNLPDIEIPSNIVSRQHALLNKINGKWYLECNSENVNMTYLQGKPLGGKGMPQPSPVHLRDGYMIQISGSNIEQKTPEVVSILFTEAQISGHWDVVYLNPSKTVKIGRRKDSNDIVLPSPYISANHAKIEYRNGSYYIVDTKSRAGIWLNNVPVHREAQIHEQDRISICDYNFFFTDNKLIFEKREALSNYSIAQAKDKALSKKRVILSADIKTKIVKNNSGKGPAKKELLRNVKLQIREGTLVALLGTAGAGKSTVMNCLNGMDTEGMQGKVIYKGQDLIANFERMKCLIGSVPQQVTIHPTFTPVQEFRFAAKLRLPNDTSRAEINERVENTLKMLHMEHTKNRRNVKLSGGEKARVNVGIELVADRELLCLDEPEAGLSPNLKHELFVILRNLAHENGKCVLTIIHDVSEIDLFDQIIIMVKSHDVGRLAFSGTPDEARKHFGVDVGQIYSVLEANPDQYVKG